MSTLMVQGWKCDRADCGHVWYAPKKPKRCASCKSPYWDKAQSITESTGTPQKAPEREQMASYANSETMAADLRLDRAQEKAMKNLAKVAEKQIKQCLAMGVEKVSHAANCRCFICKPPKEAK